MSTLRFVSGNQVNNNGGVTVVTGTVDTTAFTAIGMDKLGSPVHTPYPTSGAELGVQKAAVGGNYLTNTDTPLSHLTTSVAGSGNTSFNHGVLRANGDNRFRSYERYHITAISVSGLVTKGGSAGSPVTLSSDDEVTGNGEFQYMINGVTPTNGDY